MSGPHSSDSGEASRPQEQWMDRRVIVAVSGGIACYKSASVVSQMAQAGASVRVLMTDAATRFVAPLTFQSLSGKPVVTSIFDAHAHHGSPHIALARWCELMLIAPASADIIAKLACGICDDVVSLVAAALPQQTPVLLAPAMNEQMWQNPVTQRNLNTIQSLLGYRTVGPGDGWQACRTQGPGRMSEPDEIMAAARAVLRVP